jgi:hypothetical protein
VLGNSAVEVTVRGASGVLDATGHEIHVGGGAGCVCLGLVVIESDASVIADRVRVELGGGILGTGTLLAPVRIRSGGFIQPGLSPGKLTIVGDVTFEPGSSLKLEVGGMVAGSDYDVLDVQGALDLGGAVTLTFVNGFAPHTNDQFQFVQSIGGAAAIQSVTVENLAPGFDFDLAQNGDTLTLTALNDAVFVPEPDSAMLGFAAVAVLAWLGYRDPSGCRCGAVRTVCGGATVLIQ